MAQTNKEYTVYKHTTPNGKVYIGITCRKPECRWNNGKGYTHCRLFYNAIKKYGWENIQHSILLSGLSKEDAEQKEIELIEAYKSNDREYGYNLMSGGQTNGHHSLETKLKLSKAHSGSRNWNYGRKHTPEECKRISDNRVYKRGSEHPSAKPILQLTLDGELVKRWGSISEASRYYCGTSIKDVLSGKYKQHRGYRWIYESEVQNAKGN